MTCFNVSPRCRAFFPFSKCTEFESEVKFVIVTRDVVARVTGCPKKSAQLCTNLDQLLKLGILTKYVQSDRTNLNLEFNG